MYRVVVHKDGQTHDGEIRLALTEQEDAEGAIIVRTDINNVLVWRNRQPLVVEEEVEGWEVFIAFTKHVS